MTEKVVRLGTSSDEQADTVLEESKGHLYEAIVIGSTKDGDDLWMARNISKAGALWLLEMAKAAMIRGDFE